MSQRTCRDVRILTSNRRLFDNAAILLQSVERVPADAPFCILTVNRVEWDRKLFYPVRMSEDDAGSRATPRGQYLPLNSKRLTTAHLRQIASALDLPTTGSADQLRQVIEGKLETDGHEAINIQVTLEDSKLIETKMALIYEGGVIVKPQPLRRETTDVHDESEDLRRALEEAV